MNIQRYTTPADVRSLLGVAEEELPDRVILLETYEFFLDQDLRDVKATLPEDFQAALDLTDAASRKLVRTTKTFAALSVARALCTSLPMFSPKDISDSKATMSRFADSPYKETIRRVEGAFAVMRKTLASVVSASAADAPITFLAAASPSYDPVVGS